MTDSGFTDEGPARRSGRRTDPGRAVGRPTDEREGSPGATRRRRPSAGAIALGLVVTALVGFGGWAWSGRVHSDDVAAWNVLRDGIEVMDRLLVPLTHGEIPPCRDSDEGLVTRTYPPSTGPQAAELVAYVVQSGWQQQPPPPSTFARLTRTENGHLLTIDVVAPSGSALVESLTARSPASAFGCLGR